MDTTDPIFKALADPHRRLLLDHLHEQNGQTLLALQAYLPTMTRFGCMKHLKVLEEAGLIVTRRVGREKFHYLNPVPIQQLYDRWVSKYAQPWSHLLVGLQRTLEEEPMGKRPPSHVYEVFIRTTPERLWQALIDGELTRQYYFGWRVESDWQPGSRYVYRDRTGQRFVEGEIVTIEPPHRLVTTFRITQEEAAPVTTVIWEITPVGDTCKLTLIHQGLDPASALGTSIIAGWTKIVSGLKTLLETARPLQIGLAQPTTGGTTVSTTTRSTTIDQAAVAAEIQAIEQERAALAEKIATLRKSLPPEQVADYELLGQDGPVHLSALFGKHNELIAVHNMGQGCSYCTLWADGFNGMIPHLESRAAFVVVSPDTPDQQAAFARQRGWNFTLVSAAKSSFTADLGYETSEGYRPGASVFQRLADGTIVRVSSTEFGPGDDYCNVFHFFDLLPDGRSDWQPKLRYGTAG